MIQLESKRSLKFAIVTRYVYYVYRNVYAVKRGFSKESIMSVMVTAMVNECRNCNNYRIKSFLFQYCVYFKIKQE